MRFIQWLENGPINFSLLYGGFFLHLSSVLGIPKAIESFMFHDIRMLKKFQGLYSTLVKYDPIFTRHEIKEAAVVEYNLQFSYIRLVRFNLAFAQFEIYSYFTMYKAATIPCRKLLFQVATCCFLPFSLDISIKTQASI